MTTQPAQEAHLGPIITVSNLMSQGSHMDSPPTCISMLFRRPTTVSCSETNKWKDGVRELHRDRDVGSLDWSHQLK
jgi:hypothetical protein